MAKCKICGAAHRACGPPTTVTPIDSHISRGGQTMGLKRYEVTVDGRHQHKTTLLLSDEDAKRMGVMKESAKPAAKAQTPENKARAPRNKQAAKPAAKSSVEAASDPDASEV